MNETISLQTSVEYLPPVASCAVRTDGAITAATNCEDRIYYRFEEIGETLAADPIEDQEPTVPPTAAEEVKRGFWRRQFQKESTQTQRNFDWLFGLYLPLICFYFDPIVFRTAYGWDPVETLLPSFQVPIYFLGFVSVMALTAKMLWGERLGGLGFWLGGLFLISSVASLLLGIFLVPFSLIGLFVGIGILGFTPLFSAFTYFRNAIRAIRAG